MKKGLLAVSLAAVLIFGGMQIALADVVYISFQGAYTEEDINSWPGFTSPQQKQDWRDNIPEIYICDWWALDEFGDLAPGDDPPPFEYEITEMVGLGTAREWIFFAAEDLLDYEFDATEGGPGAGIDDLEPDPNGADYYAFVDNATTNYLHYSDGVIPAGTWFGIRAYALDDSGAATPFDPSAIQIHATPIPSALLLLGSGFVGLVGLRRFRKK